MQHNIKWILTISSIGVVAYVLTDTFHELIGHGGACLLVGSKIDLITSVYFKSHPGHFITDIGGSVTNLLIGLLIHVFLKNRKSLSLLSYLFLLTIMAYNLFWFSGTILDSGIVKIEDWTYAIKQLNIGALEKPVLIIAGVIAYMISIRMIRLHVSRLQLIFPKFAFRQSVIYSWFAAAIAAVIATLFYASDRKHAVVEGLLEMAGLIPILFIIPGKQAEVNDEPKTSLLLPVSVFILFIIFCITLGRGMVY